MTCVVVNDASCLIDLRKGQLLHVLSRLPYRFIVPLPIRESELLDFTPQEWAILDDYLEKNEIQKDAKTNLLKFLEWDEPDEERFAQEAVKIVLVSAEFSRELTTTVMWLNHEFGLDIRCVRICRYTNSEEVHRQYRQLATRARHDPKCLTRQLIGTNLISAF